MRGDGIKHLARNGHPLVCQVTEQLPADSQPLVDLEALVNIRVIDQTLPSDRCAWLLEVGAHDDKEVVFELVCQLLEAVALLKCHLGIVDRAWTNHDHKSVILL